VPVAIQHRIAVVVHDRKLNHSAHRELLARRNHRKESARRRESNFRKITVVSASLALVFASHRSAVCLDQFLSFATAGDSRTARILLVGAALAFCDRCYINLLLSEISRYHYN
jgi:hypothetical protein